ncbi:MAG: alpha/beta hydrolase [Deinococcota bacterium]
MFITINGAKLWVDIQGSEDNPTIIAHHGGPGMGSHVSPKKAFTPLADDYRVITFDARGSGQSDGIPPYSHAQWVADLDGLRKHFGLDKFILTGGSYGGYISLEYILTHPERVSHLMLRDTAPSNHYETQAKHNALNRASEFPEINEADLERIFAGKMRDDDDFRDVFAMIAPLYDANYDPDVTAERVANITFRADTHNAAFSTAKNHYDVTDRLHNINVPTLVMVGRHDWITPLAASEEMAEKIPNAELVIFENSGHSPQLEENERFIQVVRDFLARHS